MSSPWWYWSRVHGTLPPHRPPRSPGRDCIHLGSKIRWHETVKRYKLYLLEYGLHNPPVMNTYSQTLRHLSDSLESSREVLSSVVLIRLSSDCIICYQPAHVVCWPVNMILLYILNTRWTYNYADLNDVIIAIDSWASSIRVYPPRWIEF